RGKSACASGRAEQGRAAACLSARACQDFHVWKGIVGKQGVPYISTQRACNPKELLDALLTGGAASAGFKQGGLLDAPKKALTERALNAEMDHHLAGDDGTGNTRNGDGRKTVTTETGKLEIDIPRDPQSSFGPQLIAKYQRRFPGF